MTRSPTRARSHRIGDRRSRDVVLTSACSCPAATGRRVGRPVSDSGRRTRVGPRDGADLRGAAALTPPRVPALAHGHGREHQRCHGIGPPPAEGGGEDEPDEHGGRQVGAQQRLPGVGHGSGRAEHRLGAAQEVEQLRAHEAMVGLASLGPGADQAAVPQAGQVLRHRRLGETQPAGQVDHAGLAPAEPQHDGQPCRVDQRPEQRHRRADVRAIHRHEAMPVQRTR